MMLVHTFIMSRVTLNAVKLRPDLTPDPFPKGRRDLIPLYSPLPFREGGRGGLGSEFFLNLMALALTRHYNWRHIYADLYLVSYFPVYRYCYHAGAYPDKKKSQHPHKQILIPSIREFGGKSGMSGKERVNK